MLLLKCINFSISEAKFIALIYTRNAQLSSECLRASLSPLNNYDAVAALNNDPKYAHAHARSYPEAQINFPEDTILSKFRRYVAKSIPINLAHSIVYIEKKEVYKLRPFLSMIHDFRLIPRASHIMNKSPGYWTTRVQYKRRRC